MEPILLWIGIILIAGFGSELLANRLGLPGVSLFIIMGAILVRVGILTPDFVEQSSVLVDLALSIIGFLIGGSLQWNRLKKLGSLVVRVLFAEFYGAFMLVSLLTGFVAFLAIGLSKEQSIALGLLLGAISAATAPAATLAVVHELRARGPLTTLVLSIVAADDGLALITYALVWPAATTMLGAQTSALDSLVDALGHLAVSIGIGIVFALILRQVFRRLKSDFLPPTFAVILLCFGLANYLQGEGLLSCMVLGIVLSNTFDQFESLYDRISQNFEGIIFTIFFILSGAHIQWEVIVTVWALALTYFLSRITGKFIGASTAATLSHAEPALRKYTGMALMPQAGVGLGLALQAKQSLAAMGYNSVAQILLNVVVATTTVYALIGPIFTRKALELAGESHQKEREEVSA